MNHFSQLLIYLKLVLEKDDFVNVVTQGSLDKTDIDKMTVFPLVNIEVNSGSFTNGSSCLFDVKISAVTDRDTNRNINTDRFFGNSNEVDSANEMHPVLNRAWTYMFRDWGKNGIVASENPSIERIEYRGKSVLDGWEIDFQLELPNNKLSLCEAFYPTNEGLEELLESIL